MSVLIQSQCDSYHYMKWRNGKMLMAIIVAIFVGFSTGRLTKKHILNSAYPYQYVPPSYEIGSWAKQLHIQQCSMINVGSGLFAIFVEIRPRPLDVDQYIREMFLGYCDNKTINSWSLCRPDLTKKRREDCRIKINNETMDVLVHRRLCDITYLQRAAKQCKCDYRYGKSLFKVGGFPTCFQNPLPFSICGLNNVCGMQRCYPFTINDRIHSVVCDPECKTHQPFCEDPKPASTKPRAIRSFWTDWSNPYCTDNNCMSLYDEAECISSITGKGDIDCLGPGTSCCFDNHNNCQCHVFIEEDTMRVIRTYTAGNNKMDQYDEDDILNSLAMSESNIGKHRDIRSFFKKNPDKVITFMNIPDERQLRNIASDDIPEEDDDEDELKEDDGQQEDIMLEEDNEEQAETKVSIEKSDMKEMELKAKDLEVEQVKQSEDIEENTSGVALWDESIVIVIVLNCALCMFLRQ